MAKAAKTETAAPGEQAPSTQQPSEATAGATSADAAAATAEQPPSTPQPSEAIAGTTSADAATTPLDLASRDKAVRHVARTFLAAIPHKAFSTGHWQAPEDGEQLPVPDGTYRIAGDDWLFRFEAGRWIEAMRALPPLFGGEDVISIPNA